MVVHLTEILPESSSSSSSSPQDHNHTYDVFLSFRGVDTRNGFTDHLYNALLDAGFITFLDDEEIETGEPLKPELESAIKSSRASIIVLSKNYASSTWCLDELVLILEQHRSFNQIVIPIFYHVAPTDVRKQQNSFGEAMEKHNQKMETETNAEKRNEWAEKMESWKRALTQVAAIKGKDANDRKETEFIKEVVSDIHRRLGVLLSSTLPRLIGMDRDIQSISSWLTNGACHRADILTVVGMGGIGKTSLAKYVFQLHCSKFDKSSFIEGIHRRCNEHFNGLLDLQKQLHGDMSKKSQLQVNDVSVYTSKIKNVLARKRVFIVLDDIGSLDQLDALLGEKGLHPGSKIIITTKDASLTERYALFSPQVQPKHTQVLLNGLHEDDSLVLLSIHAFKSHKPKEGYKEVSEKLVKYCEGHPLALEVLGRSLQKQDVAYWKECIKGLKKEPHFRIKEALKMSIESLPSDNDKELFKHIVCFFVGIERYVTETILSACDINTRSGITNLIDRCLLYIGWNNELMMHQLVQEMGKYLVRHESPHKPWERSRLWCHEESFKVLKQKNGTENLIGLAFDMRMLGKEKLSGSLELETDSLSKMDSLKLLRFDYVKISGSYKYFPKELRWLCMHGSPLKFIPLKLPMENLVALDMSHSNLESFDMSYSYLHLLPGRLKWLIGLSSKDKPVLGSLKILDLSFCEKLHSLGGFLELPALERLIVRNCISLVKVCDTVEQCVDLAHIDLRYCYKLKQLPIILRKLKKVETLLLDGCNTQNSSSTISSDFKFFTISLPSSLRVLSLANNNLSNSSFPMDFSYLSLLEELCLDNNPIVSMPNCVRTLPRLKKLDMINCKTLISIEHPPRTLISLKIFSHSFDLKCFVRKIKFDTEMSPLLLDGVERLQYGPLEIDGMVNIEAMTCVEEKILHSLGWTNFEFIKDRRLKVYSRETGRFIECETQMYYEFGIFSTFYEGNEMPNWISCRSQGPSISFTIPSSPNNLRGLNFCCTMEKIVYEHWGTTIISRFGPEIRISNITKNHTWIYKHLTYTPNQDENLHFSLLSHWMFGPNEMKAGDLVTITVERDITYTYNDKHVTKECGISFVYEDDEVNEEEEDVLG